MNSLEKSNTLYTEAQDKMALLPNYYRWIYQRFANHIQGTVLELGAGAGHMIPHYIDQADKVYAIDYNQELLDRLSHSVNHSKLDCVKVDLRGNWHELNNIKADAILAFDVLEHFEDDQSFIKKTRAQLKPGGKLLLKVPAQSSLYCDIDSASGHYRRYDDSSLLELIESAGFKLIRQGYMNPMGALLYKLKRNSKTNFSKTFSEAKLRRANLLMPLLATLDIIPILKGLSLIGIYEAKTIQ